jgi:unsaturated rhamnogalacturonyl hydrolase
VDILRAKPAPALSRAALKLMLLLSLSLFSIATLSAAPAYVTGNALGCTGISCTASLTGTNHGDLIVLGVFVLNSTSVSSVTDSQGNTFTLLFGPTTWGGSHNYVERLYYAKNVAGGADDITVTLSASKYLELHAYDYSGLDPSSPVDASATPATGTGASGTSGSLTTTNANDLLFALFHSDNDVNNAAGAGYTLRPDGLGEDRNVTSTGSYSATMSFSGSADYVAYLVAFKAASSGGGGPTCAQNLAVGNFELCGEVYNDVSSGTNVTVNYSPSAGNGIIAWATWCFDSQCDGSISGVTATIGDNVNAAESCFAASPHSPFITDANGGGQGSGDFQQHYVWYCPSIPSGVTSFTMTPSNPNLRDLQLNITEWKAGSLAASCSPLSACFENVDNLGQAGNSTGGTTATIITSGPTVNANDLIFAVTEVPCCSFTASPGPGYTGITVAPSLTVGMVSEAMAATTTGVQTATTTWTGGSTPWFGVIVPIIGASSVNDANAAASGMRSLNPTPETIGSATNDGLNFSAPPPAMPSQAQVLEALEKVNNYWMANERPGNSDWTQAEYFEGDLAAYEATGQANYLSAAQSWASEHHYSLDGGNDTTYANYQAAGQVYIRLYELDKNSSYISGITQSIAAMVNSTVDDEWTSIDAINMSMPDFAELGPIYDKTAYYTKMYDLYSYTKYSLGLFDSLKNLWWENSAYARTSTYWSRGNGWVFAAHAHVLSVLPISDPHYAEYLSTFKSMAAALAACQQPGGYWNSDLGGTDDAGPESSGTSLFLYGIAWGLNNGILDQATYLPVVENAWNFLANTAIQTSGRLGYVQPPGNSPGPTTATTTGDFGVGAFLLAARQMELLTN